MEKAVCACGEEATAQCSDCQSGLCAAHACHDCGRCVNDCICYLRWWMPEFF